MRKTNKVFTVIAVHLALLIGIGILGTFLSDFLTEINWFGDVVLTDDKFVYQAFGGKSQVKWGARHYWYNWGCFLFAVLSVFRCIVTVYNIVESE